MRTREVNVGTVNIGGKNQPRVMGVINLSPESFYQQSVIDSDEHLEKRVEEMLSEGVDIIDIGGSSTAPKKIYGTKDVEIEKECERVQQGIKVIRKITDTPISIDTTSAEVAEKALLAGAQIVNDVSGLQNDPQMASIVAEYDVPVILMAFPTHSNFTVSDAIKRIKASIDIAIESDIKQDKIIIDPGVGFGKPAKYDVELIRQLNRFKIFEYPVLVGVSRKAFIGKLVEQPNPNKRLTGTISATAIAVVNGADIIRAHDVYEAVQACTIGYNLRYYKQTERKKTEFVKIRNEYDGMILLDQIGTGKTIIRSLSKKMFSVCIRIRKVRTPGALILKQEMLALGGDAAYHHDTIDSKVEYTDVVLMGTLLQIEKVQRKIKKMKYFGLDSIGKSLEETLQQRQEYMR